MKSIHRKRVNLKDVSKEAQTSLATVSRVFNDSGYCSEEIRSGVQKAVEKLDCQPNSHAKNLRQRRNGTTGLLIPNLSIAFAARLQMISGVTEAIRCGLPDYLIYKETFYETGYS